jgi:hypothetical protein
MNKVRLISLVAIIILWPLSFLVHNVPFANAEANTTVTVPVGGATSGGVTQRMKVIPGTYVVRTVWNDAPLTKVRVEWHNQMNSVRPVYFGETIRVGTANFRPKSGSYYLTADWRPDGNFERPRKPGDRFGWYGGNPLLVSSEASEVITLMLEEVPSPPLSVAPSGTGIFGRVTLGGAPVAGIGVYAYAKTASGFKGDDYQAITRTNPEGEFSFKLPPDKYYLLARLRADKSVNIGPLFKDDILGYAPGNPVVVHEGRYTVASIPATRLKMVKTRAESSADIPAKIEGRIIDRTGRPVSGTYAALYEKPNMTGRSIFRSEPVGADGRFKLSVPISGTYDLGARSGYGTPVAGGWFGAWGGNNDHSIKIKVGDNRAGVEIVVDRLSRELKSSE